MKHYNHIGACPLVFNVDGRELHVEPATRFSVAMTPELEAFLTQIQAISVVPDVQPDPFTESQQ